MSFILTCQEFEMFLQNAGKTKKKHAICATSSHCTLHVMADSVQWLRQSDYSIYISIPVEFH